jgi:hypothetical protein
MNQRDFYPLRDIDQNGFAVAKSGFSNARLDSLINAIEYVRVTVDGGTVSAGLRYLLLVQCAQFFLIKHLTLTGM